ncbi:MAG TPA: type II secretion system F family protein [Patescibacteria group bacterium]|nr:type II secretion system F family protein [Patescibacteria group bacterium]
MKIFRIIIGIFSFAALSYSVYILSGKVFTAYAADPLLPWVVVCMAATAALLAIFWFGLFRSFFRVYTFRMRLPAKKVTRQASFWPALTAQERLDYVGDLVAESGMGEPKDRNAQAMVVVIALLVLFLLDQYFLFMGAVGLLAAGIAILLNRRRKRKEMLVRSFPMSLEILISSLRAGFSFPQAITATARESTGPMADVFKALVRAYEYKFPLQEAVRILSVYVRMEDWDNFGDCLRINAKVGGDIIPALEALSKTIFQRQEIESETKTATASGRMSGVIVSALAPLGCFLFYIMSPEYIAPLFTTTSGNIMLVLALGLELAGAAWIWKITQIDF